MLANGSWSDERQANLLDGGAPFYGSYRCSDGKFICIAPLEPQFYDVLLRKLGIDDELLRDRSERANWPVIRERLTQCFASRSRDDWCRLLEGSVACFAPVLSLAEAPLHPHNVARGSFVPLAGAYQPAPAPRFGRTVSQMSGAPRATPEAADEVLRETGFDTAAIEALRRIGVICA